MNIFRLFLLSGTENDSGVVMDSTTGDMTPGGVIGVDYEAMSEWFQQLWESLQTPLLLLIVILLLVVISLIKKYNKNS